MKNSFRHIITLTILFISFCNLQAMEETDSLMTLLEKIVANRGEYVSEREKNITDLKHRLASTDDDEQRYGLIGELFDTYKPFNTDSAYYYSLQREEVAKRMNDPVKILDARMNQATALQAVGMYHEVSAIMRDIHPSQLPDYLLPYYYHIIRTLKGNMADFSAFSPIRAKYLAETRAYRDSIIKVNEPGTLAHVLSVADQYNSYGQYDKAVDIMTRFMSEHELSDHDKAICAWTLADSYQHLGDNANLKKQLIISSIGDMKAAVREYVSLRQLALLLFKEGDFERAYRFMNISMEDANKSNARQRLVELSALYPEITGIYVEKIQTQRHALQTTLWIIGLLAFVLVLALAYVWKQMKVISRSRQQLAVANDSLNTLNARLQSSNSQLNSANTQLKDTNTQLNEANAQLNYTNTQLNEANAQLNYTNAQLNEANTQLNHTNAQLNEANTQLNHTNAQLNEANDKLNEANSQLQESYRKVEENSRLKEAYIGKYMDQCVTQIDSLDSFRKALLKLLNSGKLDELRTRLKSTDSLDDRLRGFYENFDTTFLNLFPNFVEDFNALLLPEEAIVPKRKGTLNTELRIFALIRLGITDSDKIARFLRYSVTTIYNYRTKVRNKARGNRSLLEEAARTL